ncbi:MAG: Kae1-associated kinase Bud32 [Thermoprotei archaeon]
MARELLGKIVEEGAEAIITIGYLGNKKVIIKQRISKPYRDPEFDHIFRLTRTKTEAKILADLYTRGLNVPAPLIVDLKNYVIIMEYIEGKKLSDIIASLGDSLGYIAEKIGKMIGTMHTLAIYHGDLTLANILITNNQDVYIIDFGLAGYSRDVEEYAIDLHLLRRNIQALAPDYYDIFFKYFITGYRTGYRGDVNSVLERFEEIRLRGRYVEERLKKRIEGEKYIE